MIGTIRKISIEGGVWALITDEGTQVELLDPPAALLQNGARAEVMGDRKNADVSVGMLGDRIRVRSFKIL